MKDFTMADIQRLIESYPRNQDTGDDFIDNRYELHNTKFGHHFYYYRLFYHLVKFLQPSLTVELGAWQATAAAHFAAGHPDGTVITIDHHGDPGDDENKRLTEEATNQYANLVYLQGWTWDMKPTVETYGKIDILFIDSWHNYEKAMGDWNDYRPLLASPALIIPDDIMGGYGPVISGMLDFWNDLPGEKFLEPATLHPGMPMGFIKVTE